MPHFIKCIKNYDKFDDLRYIIYTKKWPTFNMSHKHILRSHYFVLIYSNLIPDSFIHDTGHPIRYANIKVFSRPNFPVYGQNSRTYTGKYISEKTPYIPIIYPVWCTSVISPKTHHWTRMIDMILKITNCKESFSQNNFFDFAKSFYLDDF